MRVYVYENDAFPGGITGLLNKIPRTMSIRRDWKPEDIYHEAAHDVLYDKLGIPDPSGADYGEAQAVHEGLAYIVEKMAGFDVEDPYVMTVDQAMILPDALGHHQAGKLLALMYGKFADKTSDAVAKQVFLKAIKNFEHVDNDTAPPPSIRLPSFDRRRLVSNTAPRWQQQPFFFSLFYCFALEERHERRQLESK